MKICMDGIALSGLMGTGLYSYTYELMDNLLQMYPQPAYDLLWDNSLSAEKWKNNSRLNYVSMDIRRIDSNYEALEHHIIKNRINLYHSPNNGFSIPFDSNCKRVCKYVSTIHDLLPVIQKEYSDKRYLDKFNRMIPNTLKQSDKIIAVSASIKHELMQFYEVPEEKIEVIYPGISDLFRHMDNSECAPVIRNKYGIEGNFILFAGSIHIRKNLSLLLRVFKYISKYDEDLKLVLVGKCDGKRQPYYNQLKKLAATLGVEHQVIFTGTVEYRDMPYFYNSALCMVNLSQYEGFSLSSVEALSCGLPVICSNISSLRETVGKEALLVDVRNEAEIRDTILELILNRSFRKFAVEKTKNIQTKFSWRSSIRKTVKVYEDLVL